MKEWHHHDLTPTFIIISQYSVLSLQISTPNSSWQPQIRKQLGVGNHRFLCNLFSLLTTTLQPPHNHVQLQLKAGEINVYIWWRKYRHQIMCCELWCKNSNDATWLVKLIRSGYDLWQMVWRTLLSDFMFKGKADFTKRDAKNVWNEFTSSWTLHVSQK